MFNQKVVLNFIYPLLACIYLGTIAYTPYPLHPIVKALPIFLLGAIVLAKYFRESLSGREILLFGIGFLFSTLGDITLATSYPFSFVVGLGFFLTAHIFYTIGFLKMDRTNLSFLNPKVAFFLFLGLVMATVVLPRTGDLLIPVGIYILVIIAMGCLASVQKENSMIFFLGALSFVISDGIIAINKFVQPVPYSSYLVMSTYYAAQALLARGILRI